MGWDLHLIMPALVLAARPLAQIAQVTYISLRDVLGEDYIRTARSKGLSKRLVYFRHAFRNIQIPVLTTIGTSIRYSIASLPVVEFFFIWPGIGLTLLQAIQLGFTNLVMDLILALGLFFIVFNLDIGCGLSAAGCKIEEGWCFERYWGYGSVSRSVEWVMGNGNGSGDGCFGLFEI